MENQKTENRGGARKGAGRKKGVSYKQNKRKEHTLLLSETEYAKLRQLMDADNISSMSKFIRENLGIAD